MQPYKKCPRLVLGAICSSIGVFSQSAAAQSDGDRGAPAADAAQSSGLEEIVVTAQRRSEKLQDVPIQITAFTSQAIEDAGIESTADVIAQVPNVTFDRGNNYRSSFITMRGLTQIANADPPVAFVLDGVPQTNQETIGVSLFDIERIEVLKGPQGALYGRNAVGGAINVITREPGNDYDGFLKAGYSDGEAFSAAAGVSGPIVEDKLLFRLAGTYKSSDGLIDNDFLGDHVDFIDHDYVLRSRVLFQPSETLTVDLRAEHGEFRAGSNYYSVVFSRDPNDFVDPQFNFKAFSDGRTTDLTAKVDYDLGFATFTSITNRTRFSQIVRGDADFRNPVASPAGFRGLGIQIGQGQNQELRTTSQEIRLVSNGDGPVRWLVGGYYLQTDRALVTRFYADFNSDPAQFENPALLLFGNEESNDNQAYAGFAQVDVDIAPTLTLTGGLRYDEDRREQLNRLTGAVREATFDHLQPKVTLTWKPQSDRLLYATYSTGFRSGGFNAPNSTVPVFDQETLGNFEIGFKSQFFGRWLTLNGAAFLTDVDDYQYFYVEAHTGSQTIDTIDAVRIKGMELEAQARLADGLDAAVAIGVIDSEIRSSRFPGDVGNRAPRTIPFSATSSLQYRRALWEQTEGFVRLEWQHYGRKYWHQDNVAVQRSYDIVNARVGVERGAVGFYGFVRNALDDDYYGEFFVPEFSGLDIATGYAGAPRTFGIEAEVKF